MKIGLVLVTIFLLITFDLPSAQALTVDTILQHYLNHQHALTTIIRRKRDKPTGPNSTLGKLSNGTSGSSDEEGRCMLQCITPMSAMANNVTSPQYNANFAVCPKYDPKVMDGMCSIYTQVKSCLAQCPQSPMVQGIMQNAFQILDFICVEKKDDFTPTEALTVDSILQHYLNHQHALTKVIRRKRDKPTGPGGSSDAAGQCILQCTLPMAAMANMTGTPFNADFAVCPKYDTKMINSLCGAYGPVKACLSKCPKDTMIQGITQDGFQMPQFLCVEKKNDMNKYGPCLSDVCQEVEKQCGPTCGSIQQALVDMMKMGEPPARMTGSNSERSVFAQLLGKMCKSTTCANNCSREIITKKCSAEAYKLQSDMLVTLLNSTTNTMVTGWLGGQWPKECQPTQLSLSVGQLKEQKNGGSSGKMWQFSLGWQQLSLPLLILVILKWN